MKTHILGFPSIGKHRELKTALESFWKGTLSAEGLSDTCTELKKRHWKVQRDAGLSYVTTGDFSLYDRMLDMTCMLGAVPSRFIPCRDAPYPARYFSLARGDAALNIPALEMTKWFDTNYHYLVPEIDGAFPGRKGNIPSWQIPGWQVLLVILRNPRSSVLSRGSLWRRGRAMRKNGAF